MYSVNFFLNRDAKNKRAIAEYNLCNDEKRKDFFVNELSDSSRNFVSENERVSGPNNLHHFPSSGKRCVEFRGLILTRERVTFRRLTSLFDRLCRLKPDMILRLIESFISTVNERDARWGSTLGLARTGQRNDGDACDAKTPGRRRRRSFVGRTTCGKTLQGILLSVRDDIFSGRDSRKKYSDLACPIYMAFSSLNNTYLLYMYIDQNSRKILSSIFF